MDSYSVDVKAVLARADDFRSKCDSSVRERRALKQALTVANTRIAELERDLALSREEIKKIENDRDGLRITLEKLDGVFEIIDIPSSPFDGNASIVSSLNQDVSSQQNLDDSSDSPNDNPPPRAPPTSPEAAYEESCSQSTPISDGDNAAPVVDYQGVDDISNYFSSFRVDSQTNYEESLLMSAIPPSIKMTLNSYQSFDKRYLVFVINEAAADSKYCHFLSIDDLLALPQNADLLAQLQASQSMSTMPDSGKNFVFLTILSHLITRAMLTLPNTNPVDEFNEPDNSRNIETQIKQEKVAVKRRGRSPKKQTPVKKRKSFSQVSKAETDLDYVPSDPSSTESEIDFKSDIERKQPDMDKKMFKIKCKVCEMVEHKTRLFNTYQALDSHILKIHQQNAFPIYFRCPYSDNETNCNRHYLKKIFLHKHIESCHPDANSNILLNNSSNTKSWQCTYCGCTFSSSRIFRKHMTDIHPGFAETLKFQQTPVSLDDPELKIEWSEKQTSKSSKILIKRKRQRFSSCRKSSLSSVDQEYAAKVVSSTSRRGRRRKLYLENGSSPEPDGPVNVVTSAEIHHASSEITEPSGPADQNVATADVGNANNQSSTTSDPTDLNEFVLNSVYEISSILETQKANSRLLSSEFTSEKTFSALQRTTDDDRFSSYQIPQFPVAPSLPCLLDNCPGCDFHPKTTLTLDDELESSCRDILAELYSIPDNPSMVPGSFTATLSSPPKYDRTPTGDKDNETHHVESSVNATSSNLVDNFDTANKAIVDDLCDQEMRNDIDVNHSTISVTHAANEKYDLQNEGTNFDKSTSPNNSSPKPNPEVDNQSNQSTVLVEVMNEGNRSNIETAFSYETQNDNPEEPTSSGEENRMNIEETVHSSVVDDQSNQLEGNVEQIISKNDRKPLQVCEALTLNNDVAMDVDDNQTNCDKTLHLTDVNSNPAVVVNFGDSQISVKSPSFISSIISIPVTVSLETNEELSVVSTPAETQSCNRSPTSENVLENTDTLPADTITSSIQKDILVRQDRSKLLVLNNGDDSDLFATENGNCESIFNSSKDVNISTSNVNHVVNKLILNENEKDNLVYSSTTPDTAVVNKEYHRELVQSEPVDLVLRSAYDIDQKNSSDTNVRESATSSTDINEMPELRISPEHTSSLNPENNPVDEASDVSMTFYDDFGLSNVCEIKTYIQNELSRESPPPLVSTEPNISTLKTNCSAGNYAILRSMSTQLSSTNELRISPERISSPNSSNNPVNKTTDVSTIFYDEFDLSHVCEVETRSENELSQKSTPPLLLTNVVPGISISASSPLPPPPTQISSSSTESTSACTMVNSSSSLNQLDQLHDAIESNYEKPKNAKRNSQLIESSKQCLISDSLPSSNGANDEKKDSDEKYFKRLGSESKHININIILTRLEINGKKPISAGYHLRRQKPLSTSLIHAVSSLKKGGKLKRAFLCKVCGQICLNQRSLGHHLNEEHQGAQGTITCSICGYVSQTKNSARKHGITHHMVTADFTECSICEFANLPKIIYDSQAALNNHIARNHPNSFPNYIKCAYYEGDCEWYFSTLEDYRDHIETYHRREVSGNQLTKSVPD